MINPCLTVDPMIGAETIAVPPTDVKIKCFRKPLTVGMVPSDVKPTDVRSKNVAPRNVAHVTRNGKPKQLTIFGRWMPNVNAIMTVANKIDGIETVDKRNRKRMKLLAGMAMNDVKTIVETLNDANWSAESDPVKLPIAGKRLAFKTAALSD